MTKVALVWQISVQVRLWARTFEREDRGVGSNTSHTTGNESLPRSKFRVSGSKDTFHGLVREELYSRFWSDFQHVSTVATEEANETTILQTHC